MTCFTGQIGLHRPLTPLIDYFSCRIQAYTFAVNFQDNNFLEIDEKFKIEAIRSLTPIISSTLYAHLHRLDNKEAGIISRPDNEVEEAFRGRIAKTLSNRE